MQSACCGGQAVPGIAVSAGSLVGFLDEMLPHFAGNSFWFLADACRDRVV